MATLKEKILSKPYLKFRTTNDVTRELSNLSIQLETKASLRIYYIFGFILLFIPPFIFGIIGLLAIYYLVDNKSRYIITDKKVMKIKSSIFKKEYSIVEIDISTIENIIYQHHFGIIAYIMHLILGGYSIRIFFKEDNQIMDYRLPILKKSKEFMKIIKSQITKNNT